MGSTRLITARSRSAGKGTPLANFLTGRLIGFMFGNILSPKFRENSSRTIDTLVFYVVNFNFGNGPGAIVRIK